MFDETVSVCAACGRSIVSQRWTAASTRRGVVLMLRMLGPVILIAIAIWLLKSFLPSLPHRMPGAT